MGPGPGRCALLGGLARAQALYRLSQLLFPLCVRVRLPVLPLPGDGGELHPAGGAQHLFLCDGKAPAQRLRQRPYRLLPLPDVSLSARSRHADLRFPAAAGPGHAVRCGALAEKPRTLYGRGDLAAQRLLAGGQLGQHRLLRTLEGAALLCQTFLRPGADLLP